MGSRVTIQDIADALGISRNTVSKAINNTPGLAEATRDRILQKAAELGYKQFSYIQTVQQEQRRERESDALPGGRNGANAQSKEIAFLSTRFLTGSHFAIAMLDQFQLELSQLGYSLSMHRISAEELESLRLPLTFQPERTSGIICAELFDYDYLSMLCSLNLPLLTVDSPVQVGRPILPVDKLMMENTWSIFSFVNHMLELGYTKLGFIGEVNHCQSFFERYISFREAMRTGGQQVREEWCLTGAYSPQENPESQNYRTYLKTLLTRLDELPEVFLCANDFAGIDAIYALRQMGYSVPEDVMICGFDDSKESRFLSPTMTTIRIQSRDIGSCAVDLLLSRMRRPELMSRTMYVSTELIYRESAPYELPLAAAPR